jgi:hypothetical protein
MRISIRRISGGARLPAANLQYAHLIQADLAHIDLTGCVVYGISAWDAGPDGAMQDELVISRPDEPAIRADRLEVTQFVYLLLNYHALDAVLAAMTSKVVLILGHFTAGQRAVLAMLREELHRRGYLTLSFDFSTS